MCPLRTSAPASLRQLPCLVTSVLVCSCSGPSQKAPADSPQANSFETTIAGIRRSDSNTPSLLNVQLNYAQSLLSGDPSTCRERLERAQEQLGSVDSSPKRIVMYPDGWATVADFEYRLHLARADCGSEVDRKRELQTAADAARRAAELYRNIFEYQSMVIMEFDASVALHEIGDNTAAIAALHVALDRDREYGLKDDAWQNYKQLLAWRGDPATDAQVAELMRDFPKRQVTLRFGWHTSGAHITLENRRQCLLDGQVVSSRAADAFDRHIDPENGSGWRVSFSQRLTEYEPGVWPVMQGALPPPMAFSPALLPEVGFKVSATGEFDVFMDSKAFSSRLAAKATELIRATAPSGARARSIMDEAINTTPADLSPGMLEAAASQSYQLETAMWIGATLDQGVWYEDDAPLSLPGMPRVVVQNRIAFAFTRMLPCTPDSQERTCAEIVIRAKPDTEALDRVMADFNSQSEDERIDDYVSSTQIRIVTDPATLLSVSREARVFWYASIGKVKHDSFLESEHLVSTTSYTDQ
jgi:hypothetical protein